MPRSNLEYSGGGCALNTARVFQWLSPTPSSAVFLGGLGKVGVFPLCWKPSIEIAGWQWGRPWKSRQQWRCSHRICKAGQWKTGSPFDLKKQQVSWEPDESVMTYKKYKHTSTKLPRKTCRLGTASHLWKVQRELWPRISGPQISSRRKISGRATIGPCWRGARCSLPFFLSLS